MHAKWWTWSRCSWNGKSLYGGSNDNDGAEGWQWQRNNDGVINDFGQDADSGPSSFVFQI